MKTPDYNFTLFGCGHNQVLHKIWQRKKIQDNKIENNSTGKIGLVIEGGGMRSIISGGFLVAMHKLGLTKIFDNIYGTSAGAICGAYFLSGQAPYGISIFFEDINNKKFIDLYRVPFHFNIDYLIDIIKNKKKLDINTIKQSRTKLIITTAEITTGQMHYFTNHEKNIDLFAALHASCALPIYYDKPVEINGKKYLDGGIVSCLPVLKAIKDGCTDILVLMTKEIKRRQSSKLPSWFEKRWLKKYGKNFIATYNNRHKQFQTAIQIITGKYKINKDVNIAALAPAHPGVHGFTINTLKLKNAAQNSYNYCLNLLLNFKIL